MDIDEQDQARRDIDAAMEKAATARTDLLDAVRRGRDAGVPVPEMAARAKVTRATIYAWLKEGATS